MIKPRISLAAFERHIRAATYCTEALLTLLTLAAPRGKFSPHDQRPILRLERNGRGQGRESTTQQFPVEMRSGASTDPARR